VISEQWPAISGLQAILVKKNRLFQRSALPGPRSTLRVVKKLLDKDCNDLVSTAELLAQLEGFETRDLGLQQVPLNRVVGSSRPQDFDLQFNPGQREKNGRRSSIFAAFKQGKYLPPPTLLKIQSSYFVVDGNHRISAARLADQVDIQARVTELESEDLVSEPKCTRLGFRPG
jgi:hypothetical protein